MIVRETEMTEEGFYFDSQSARLYGFAHVPEGKSRATGLVFCPPFGEEKKASIRTYVETARALAAQGFPCLRFDYVGTGDSDGDLRDADVDLWLRNIVDVMDVLRERSGCREVALLGLRLGGLLAAEAARLAAVRALILWQPTVHGKSYFEGELKRKLVREMMTSGKGATRREDVLRQLEQGACLDLDGYEITSQFYRSLVNKVLPDEMDQWPERCLLLQVSFSERLTPEIEGARSVISRWRTQLDLKVVIAPPLWSRVEIQDYPEIIETTTSWTVGHLV